MTLAEDIAGDMDDLVVGDESDFGADGTFYSAEGASGESVRVALWENQGVELSEDTEGDRQDEERRGTLTVKTSDVGSLTRRSYFVVGGERWDVERVESEGHGGTVLEVVARADWRRGEVD